MTRLIWNWWKGKPSGSIACTRKQQPRFYWSQSVIKVSTKCLKWHLMPDKCRTARYVKHCMCVLRAIQRDRVFWLAKMTLCINKGPYMYHKCRSNGKLKCGLYVYLKPHGGGVVTLYVYLKPHGGRVVTLYVYLKPHGGWVVTSQQSSTLLSLLVAARPVGALVCLDVVRQGVFTGGGATRLPANRHWGREINCYGYIQSLPADRRFFASAWTKCFTIDKQWKSYWSLFIALSKIQTLSVGNCGTDTYISLWFTRR